MMKNMIMLNFMMILYLIAILIYIYNKAGKGKLSCLIDSLFKNRLTAISILLENIFIYERNKVDNIY